MRTMGKKSMGIGVVRDEPEGTISKKKAPDLERIRDAVYTNNSMIRNLDERLNAFRGRLLGAPLPNDDRAVAQTEAQGVLAEILDALDLQQALLGNFEAIIASVNETA